MADYEPLSPVQIESKLRGLVNAISKAQKELSAARDVETETEIVLKKARLSASHSEDCPKVSRGGTTVAERDEWIDARTVTEWEAHRRAITMREIAQDACAAGEHNDRPCITCGGKGFVAAPQSSAWLTVPPGAGRTPTPGSSGGAPRRSAATGTGPPSGTECQDTTTSVPLGDHQESTPC